MMKFRQALFWDVNPANIDAKQNSQYIIERVLDLGTDKEVRWVWNFYEKELLKKIISRSRSLRPETKALWKLLLKDK